MSESPLADPILRSVIGGLITWLVGLSLWILGHTRHDAKREAKQDQMEREIGHQSLRGSILERLHRFSGHLRRIRERLSMENDE